MWRHMFSISSIPGEHSFVTNRKAPSQDKQTAALYFFVVQQLASISFSYCINDCVKNLHMDI